MIVICDECKKEFKIKLRVRILKEDIEEEYFICPQCKAEYRVNLTNEKCRELRSQLQDLQKQYSKRKTTDKFNRIKKIQKEFRKEMLKLNKELK
ncbi:hypothetical protein [Senegalia massiliensis]|uniref:Transglycosylase n=1 Tax=Senegalia massiliensis TaxID=1720316 RepID=A0A845R3I2_9CLOT|nr:hypothetical protein [Senegalia massiliensis]NBI08236.1 hypothetical protein [Senegalia massiliensis]